MFAATHTSRAAAVLEVVIQAARERGVLLEHQVSLNGVTVLECGRQYHG